MRWLDERAGRPGAHLRFAYQKRGAPVSSISDQLLAIRGAEVHEVEGAELAAYCGRLYDGVAACAPGSESDAVRVMHRPQPVLDAAAATAAKKGLGDGAFVFDRTASPEDASPIMACAMALGLLTAQPETKTKESAYTAERGMMVV